LIDALTQNLASPGELIEELLGGLCATGLHVLIAVAHTFDCFLVVLTLPFRTAGNGIIEGISGALAAPAGELF
jgi:hypothetical protein